MAKAKTLTGLPRPMPLAPGNAKAGQPPRREEAGGEKPSWLDPRSAAWSKERVDSWDRRMKAKAGSFEVQHPEPRHR